MKKTLAMLALAALPLFADVVIPGQERKPRPTPQPAPTDTVATGTVTTTVAPTDTAVAVDTAAAKVETPKPAPVAPAQAVPSRRQPILWFSVAGVAIIILIAARRKAATRAE